jgi:dimeric dUTPase (all-alpha-NTP-PPase superfamily)
MDLTKLFETQKILRDRINYNEPDRFNKLVLSLLVELGECANEWRGFKFWSKDQKQRKSTLEEYVDILHFVLELGLELGQTKRYKYYTDAYLEESITDQFRAVFYLASVGVYPEYPEEWFNPLFAAFVSLGKMLGFTWEEVEQAYMEKNRINHERQSNGY